MPGFSVKSTVKWVYMVMAEHRCITKWGNYAAGAWGYCLC
jgi:hypothetical protein